MVQSRRSQLAASRGLNAASLKERTYCREVRPVVSSTQRYYDATKKAWKEFLGFMSFTEAEIEASVRDGADLPKVATLKRFLEWYIGGSKGQLGEYVTLSSAENYWHRLATCFARWTGKEFPDIVDGDMLGYIRGSLRTEYDLKDIMKEKGYADEVDIDILNTQLFHHDFNTFFHDRTPIEMAFLLHLHLYLGNRPGSVLPNQDYPNLYLRYRHITLTLDKRKDGTLRYGIMIEQDSMKGKKRRHAPLVVRMYEESRFLHCPVTLLLALAFADDAFEGISSPDELHAFKIQEGNDCYTFRWKTDMLEKPILKCPERKSEGVFWYTYWWNHLKILSLNAGYCEYTRPYNIRRAVANRLHENAPSQSVDQILGHMDHGRTYIRHYQDKLSSIDIQGLMRRSKQDDDFHIERYRRSSRGLPPPSSLPASREQDIINDTQLLEIIRRFGRNSKEYKKRHGALKKRHWSEFLNEFHQKNLQQTVSQHFESNSKGRIPLSIETLGDLRDPRTRAAVARRYVPNWAVIRGACEGTMYSVRTMPHILETLMTICRTQPKDPVVYYPGEAPQHNNGEGCHICGKHVLSMKAHKRADHMHNCFRKSKRAGPSRAEYCMRCNAWFSTIDDFRNHCKDHLEELDMYCGILRCRGLVAAGGRCPFCISDAQLDRWGDWHKMLHQFTTSNIFAEHLKSHLRPYFELPVVFCPHPLCTTNSGYSVPDLARHFYDDHGINEACGWTESTLIPPSKDESPTPGRSELSVQGSVDPKNDPQFPATDELWTTEEILPSDNARDHVIPQQVFLDPLEHTSSGILPSQNDQTLGNTEIAHLHSRPKVLSKRLLRQNKIRLKRQKRM